MQSERTIQNTLPTRTETCGDIASYANAVWRACSAGEAIADYGRYHAGLGHAPRTEYVQIDPPAGLIEHDVADMTVRVLGGTTLGDIQQVLAPHRQFLPLDGPPDMTIAEAVTHNVSGPLRISHGTARDLLLGLKYIDADGQVISVGGRTVKNVAGYDVTRLLAGSLNMLGLIAEVTLRTAAWPRNILHVEVDGVDPAAFTQAGTELLLDDAAPWSLVWEHRNTMQELRPNVLRFAYAGTERSCGIQRKALERWLNQRNWLIGDLAQRTMDLSEDQAFRASRASWRETAGVLLKIVVPPAQAGAIAESLFQMDAPPPMIDALPAHGVIYVGAGWSVERALEIDDWLLGELEVTEGFRVWLRRPEDSPLLEPVRPDQPDWTMLMRLKSTLDPNARFNPGRFP